ncbi:unnamed protein product [marine sediment metagenome]|uniref:Enoyl reductase (ER) domain-containing protein n=1 Tax=marine sediment metagenome TaxID=412755 RepID=X1AB11_9ZZZZ
MLSGNEDFPTLLINAIKKNKVISIIGLSKNVSKTTTLNHIINLLRDKQTIGVTSIGRDGEPYDAITELPKPKIIVEEGTIFATAEGSLKNSDIEAELIKSTDFTTPLGIINVYKAKNTGGTALTGLRDKVNIQEGQKVLIIGASGGVGSFAVQIARTFTTEVTGVCSTSTLSMVESLGAKAVIDYTKEDFTKNGQTYDIIFDAVGRKVTSYSKCKNSLTENGIFVTVDLQPVIFKYMLNNKVKGYLANVDTEKLDYLRDLIEAGKIKSTIDKVYPLSQIADAHRYYEEGHTKGKVIISVV